MQGPFFSAEDFEASMLDQSVKCRVYQIGKGKLQISVEFLDSAGALIMRDWYSKAMSMSIEAPPNVMGIMFAEAVDGQMRVCGEPARNDSAVVHPAGTELEIMTSGAAGSTAVLIEKSRFAEITNVVCPNFYLADPSDINVVYGDPFAAQTLSMTIKNMLAESMSDDRALADNLLAELIAWIGDSSNQWRMEGFSVQGRKAAIARRAKDYFENNYTKSVTMESACRELDVGLRTLQRAFAEYFQITPYGYLKVLRYNKANRRLRVANASSDSVTAIAIENGFSHLGRFAVEYREHFGEHPRQTLAQAV